MSNYKIMETIASGLKAANKIQNLRNSRLREDSRTFVKPDNISVLSEALQILSEHHPKELHKKGINDTAYKSRLYCDTYKNLKYHLKNSKNQKPYVRDFVKTLGIVKPALDNRKQSAVDKILKVFEILES